MERRPMGFPHDLTEECVMTLESATVPVVTHTPGGVDSLPSTAREVDFFNLLFPASLFDLVVNETNRYASSKGPDPKWRETTEEELRAFVACNIIMGVVVLPDQKSICIYVIRKIINPHARRQTDPSHGES
jgi:hypothetical protein